MSPLFSLCLLMNVLTFSGGSSASHCEDGNYYSIIDNLCKKCSSCPTNQIIKHPCTNYADIKCGPFKFIDFPDPGNELPYRSSADEMFDEKDYYTLNTKIKDVRTSSRRKSSAHDMESPTTMEKEDREYWKTLAIALIGLLSVLIVVATIVVLLACRKLQKAAVIKQPDEGDMDDADSGYVVIRAIRIVPDARPGNADLSLYTKDEYKSHLPLLGPSSDMDLQPVDDTVTASAAATSPHPRRLCFLPNVYKPQRRLLNYDADDVFESDDSGSSFIIPGKSKLQINADKALDLKRNSSSSKKNGNSK
ncbi:unnamed protein product [Candidula unifasciata]|uniref:TNFR-Cys domain-containing protein n=1 Tax=Candidula unifasciata TaxID=100452 RepID=A0A8S4A4Z1_9EUPU|nr:unnamed protein product [Candidula unifasciata]